MDISLVDSLGKLGVPAAILAAVVVTWMFRSVHHKLAVASGIITLCAVIIYIPIEMYPRAIDSFSNTTININPDKFYAFNISGKPIEVEASCMRGSDTVEKITIEKEFPSNWSDRNLFLEHHPKEQSLIVKSNGTQIGRITEHTLKSIGYTKTSSINPCSKLGFLSSSKKVYRGDTWVIGDTGTALGELSLMFDDIQSGKVSVKLKSSQLASPKPEFLSIKNKSFDTQTFESKYEVTVQVREANFQLIGSEWAAFTIIVSE